MPRTSFSFSHAAPAEASGAETADLGTGGLFPLALTESPAAGGLLSAATSGTFNSLGIAARKSFEIELESGDQLSAYVNLIEDNASYDFWVEDAAGTLLLGSYYGVDYPVQRLEIPSAGTYRIPVAAHTTVTDFDLRIDVGRNIFLEAENNDTSASANTLTFGPASGGYQQSVGGALSPLDYNTHLWQGSNDVNGDFYDLGHLSAGNSVDITYQLPAASSLAAGDLEIALFREGESEPEAISTLASGLNATVTSSGKHFARIAPNDNLDGTRCALLAAATWRRFRRLCSMGCRTLRLSVGRAVVRTVPSSVGPGRRIRTNPSSGCNRRRIQVLRSRGSLFLDCGSHR